MSKNKKWSEPKGKEDIKMKPTYHAGNPMTLSEAKSLTYHQEIYDRTYRNADGTPARWRVSGKIQTWKKDPKRIKIPIKHGMYDTSYITESNLSNFSIRQIQQMKFSGVHKRKSKKWSEPKTKKSDDYIIQHAYEMRMDTEYPESKFNPKSLKELLERGRVYESRKGYFKKLDF